MTHYSDLLRGSIFARRDRNVIRLLLSTYLHIWLLSAKLNEVGKVLQALGDHDKGARSVGRRWLRNQIKTSGVEHCRAQKAEEDEAADDASAD